MLWGAGSIPAYARGRSSSAWLDQQHRCQGFESLSQSRRDSSMVEHWTFNPEVSFSTL